MILISPFKTDVCCGVNLAFKEGLSVLDVTKCSKFVTCKHSPDFRKDIIETSCSTGYHLSGGCVKSSLGQTSSGSPYTTTCYCTPLGMQCPDELFQTTCTNMQPHVITDDDEMFVLEGSSNKTLVIKLKPVITELRLVPLDKPVEFVSISIKNGKVETSYKNAKNQECQTVIDGEVCKYFCKDDDCKHSCNIPEKDKKVQQIKAKVMCGDVNKQMWLFRSEYDIAAPISAHGNWRSHSKSLGILLLIDLAFGYVIFRLLTGLAIYLYRIICSISMVFSDNICKFLYGFASSAFGSCEYCGTRVQNVYDAYLHDRYCPLSTCPYCKESGDVESEHVNECSEKNRAIQLVRAEKSQEISEKIKQINKDVKLEIWKNELTMKRLPTKLWIFSLVVIGLFLIISPSSALSNKPCTRLVGRTSKCSSKNDIETLGSDVDEHNYWSQVELGMLEKLEEVHIRDDFASNAIHRIKVDSFHMQGNSMDSLVIDGKKCKSNGVCKAVTEVKWVSGAFRGNIQMFKTEEKGYHMSTLNVFLADVEVVFPLQKEYTTSDWQIDVKSKFSCVDTDCSKLCNTDEKKSKCLVKKVSKSKDTSWAHNPVWCWSINSGCTCMEAFIRQKHDASNFDVYKPGVGVMRGLLCIEYNSMYINCLVVDRAGTFEMGRNRVQITKWSTNAKPPKKIIVERSAGSNNSFEQAITGPTCERENCNAGDAGDWQFDNISRNCESDMYFNSNGLQPDIQYEFGHSPDWEVSYPKYGSFRYKRYSKVNSNGDHHVDMKKGALVLTDGNFGTFALEVVVSDFEVYEIIDESKISNFKVARCVGEYMSIKGSICTFLVTLLGADRTTVRVVSNDDSTYIQGDVQMISSGQNGFRKFMYVRNKQSSYSFCIIHGNERICDNIKYNLTEPKHTWSISPSTSSTGETKEIMKKCDLWFGLSCMVNRILDFFKTMWSALWVLVIGLCLYVGAKLLFKFFEKSSTKKNDDQPPDRGSFLNKSIKRSIFTKRRLF